MVKKQINNNKSNKGKQSKHKSVQKLMTRTELEEELENLDKRKQKAPSSRLKNKVKRQQLVTLRNTEKKHLKTQLRRKKQKEREELGTETPNKTFTIESLRVPDKSFVDAKDEEMKEEDENDEFSRFFKGEYDPQILLTTSIKHTGAVYKFIKELRETIPNCYFYERKKFNLNDIIEEAKGRGFTSVIVVYERVRKPYRMLITHLPNGPTVEFKISNVWYMNEIKDHGFFLI